MARYYFDAMDEQSLVRDAAGVELPDDRAAVEVARTYIARIIADLPIGNLGNRVMQIRAADGRIVASVPFHDAVRDGE